MAALFPFHFPSLPSRALVILTLVLLLRHVTSLPSSANETAARENPFSARAATIRYWNHKVPTNRPQPAFLLSKLSPLSAHDSATFSFLAATGPSALSARLPAFCSAARLLCPTTPTLTSDHPPSEGGTVAPNGNRNYVDGGGTVALNGNRNYVNGNRNYVNGNRNYVSGGGSVVTDDFRIVEPGMFFRERDLQSGNVMPMPDIRDKMPLRSFLPRSIASSIPFSADEVRRTFRIHADTMLGKAVDDTVVECKRKPNPGEIKQCMTSAEDMIDFAVAVLGIDVVVRSTESTAGSKRPVMVGKVWGVNGGNVTQSVTCHQSLFPYLVYFCHSVMQVRLYVADILAMETKERINGGVAICHINTSDWSASHEAFLALGSAPGKIEVCHWIFEGDMTWMVAD